MHGSKLINRRNSVASAAAIVLTSAMLGCGAGGIDATTVQGVISYEGKPAPFGGIAFSMSGGRPIGGQISADGAYSVELPPGEYQVRIDTTPPVPEGWTEGQPMPPLPPRPIPEPYANFASSGLTTTINDQSEPQQVDFKLP